MPIAEPEFTNSCACRIPPLPALSPLDKGGEGLYQSRERSLQLPPSFRFPPLREGNRVRRAYSVPPASRGNLKEGVINCCFFVNFGLAIGIKGVGFLRACLLAALPSRAFLLSCERDARVPRTRDAGNAGVPPAMPPAREKTYPFEGRGSG